MAQLNKQRYLKRLQTAIGNNEIIREETTDYFRTVKTQGVPEPIGYTIEQEEKNYTLQREKAFENLQKISRGDEITKFMNDNLSDLNELVKFNNQFVLYLDELRGQRQLSALRLQSTYDKFREKMTLSDDTGILPTGLTKTDLEKLARESLNMAITVLKLGDVKKTIDELAKLQPLKPTELYHEFNSILEPDELKDGEVKLYIGDDKLGTPQFVVKVLDERKASGLPYYRSPTKGEQLRETIYRRTGTLLPTIEKTKSKKKKGKGLIRRNKKCCGGYDEPVITPKSDLLDFKINDKLKFEGYGTPKNRPKKSRKDLYANFGNYLIHLPSLNNGYLNIKYKTYKAIKNMPKQLITNDVKELIKEILKTSKFSVKKYENLDYGDKILIDEIIQFCKLEGNDAINFLNYKSTKSNERDKDLKRFNLLVGEISSGNNNPVIIQELKLLLFKMYKENNISNDDFRNTLYMLSII